MRHLRRILSATIASAALCVGCVTACAEATFFTESGIHGLEHWFLTSDGALFGKSEEGEGLNIGPPQAALLDIPGAHDSVPSYPQVLLNNGEILSGNLVAGEATDEITIDMHLFGKLRLRSEEVLEIRFTGIRPGEVPAPCVVLSNGDVVSGRIVGIKSDRVVVESVFGETPIDRRVLARLVFGSGAALSDGRADGEYLVVLSDEQRVHAERLDADTSGEEVRLRRSGKDGQIPRGKIQRIVFPGWRSEYLSVLPHKIVETVPYFDGPVEVRRDGNAAGGPLWLGGRWFKRGLGTQPRSRVRFELGGEWEFLSGWVGLDDHLGKMGNASASLIADGKVVYASEEVRAGQKPGRLAVEVSGVKELDLVADFGKRGPLGDYVNWCDMLLVGRR